MIEFEVLASDADIRSYDAQDLARKEKFARVAIKSAPVRFNWVSPKLNPDGSLADEEQAQSKRKAREADEAKLKRQWSPGRS